MGQVRTGVRWVWGAALVALAIGAAPAPAERVVDMHIRVLSADGEPVEGVGVIIQSENGADGIEAELNASGSVTVPVIVPEGDVRVRVGVWARPYDPDRDPSLTFRFREFREAMRRHVFDAHGYSVGIAPDQEEVSITIRAAPSVTLSGRLVDHTGAPVESASVLVAGTYPFYGVSASDAGRFARPVVKDRSVHVLFSMEEVLFRRTLDGDRLREDHDMGDVAAPAVPAQATIGVTIDEGDDGGDDPWVGGSRLVSLFRADGAYVLGVVCKPDPVTGTGMAGSIGVPAGTYVIVPGVYSSQPACVALHDLLERGGLDDAPEGLPIVRVGKGESVSLTVDWPACVEALETLGSPEAQR